MPSHRPLFLAIVLAFSLPLSASTKTKPDVRLDLRVESDRQAFFLGEEIPVLLRFSSTAKKKYQINEASYDRSGRMNYERFSTEPAEGTADPLYSYFHSGIFLMTGGLTNFHTLSSSPDEIRLTLNEYLRVDKPGHYQVSVDSERISIEGSSAFGSAVKLRSNPVEIEIKSPSPAWLTERLLEAKNLLHSKNAADHLKGARILRFLNTQDALEELTELLTGNGEAVDWEVMLGLQGYPDPALAKQIMWRKVGEPSFPVSSMFLQTWSELGGTTGKPADAYKQHSEELERGYIDLANVVENKDKYAKPTTLATLFFGLAALSEQAKARVARQLGESFLQLPIDTQRSILSQDSSTLPSDFIVPALRSLATQKIKGPDKNGGYSDWEDHTRIEVAALAFKRWYEIEPLEARKALVDRLISERPIFDGSDVGFLKDGTIPELDQPMLTWAFKDDDFWAASNAADLISRYGSNDAVAPVLNFMDDKIGKIACKIQNPLLIFLLKAEPSIGAQKVREALAAKGDGFTGCYGLLQQDLANAKREADEAAGKQTKN